MAVEGACTIGAARRIPQDPAESPAVAAPLSPHSAAPNVSRSACRCLNPPRSEFQLTPVGDAT
jgi:hypothetical protein